MKILIEGIKVNFRKYGSESSAREFMFAVGEVAKLTSENANNSKIDFEPQRDSIRKLIGLEESRPNSLAFLNVIYQLKSKNSKLKELNLGMLYSLEQCLDTRLYLDILRKDWGNKPIRKLEDNFIRLVSYVDYFSENQELIPMIGFDSKDEFYKFVVSVWSKILIGTLDGELLGQGSITAVSQFYKPDKNFILFKSSLAPIELPISNEDADKNIEILRNISYCKSLVISYKEAKFEFENLNEDELDFSEKLLYILERVQGIIDKNKAGNEDLFESQENYSEFYSQVWLKLIIANLKMVGDKSWVSKKIDPQTKAIHQKFLKYYGDSQLSKVYEYYKNEKLSGFVKINDRELPRIDFPEESLIKVYLGNYNRFSSSETPKMF